MTAEMTVGSSQNTQSQHAAVHVLFIMDQICQMGGAERVLLNMIRLLPKDRFRCSAVTFKIDPSLGVFDEFPCPLTVLPLKRTYDATAARVAWKLRSLIRTGNVQIVHTFFETSDLWGGLIAKLSGCPILISSRRDMGILRGAKHRWAYRWAAPLFDEVQTVSEQVRQFCIEQDHLDSRKVKTLYNGVAASRRPDPDRLLRLRENIGMDGAGPVITTLGHVRQIKGCDIFIRAAVQVCRLYPKALFLIAGENHEPEHYAELGKMIRDLQLEQNVRLLGGVRDVSELLAVSQIFCLPSRSEGLSNALLEAMAAGLPSVATRVGGNSELIEHGRNGYLVAPENPDELANAIIDLIRSPENAARLGAESRLLVQQRFTEESMMDELVRSYERLLCKHAT
ncbi:MAG TPA: glycosyltransferase [Bryobacteraceae bacterium]|jgi:glycosyltransferase involved in cell wall biosynthesis|nr:glycosyltransferase [Bryobacteraceae bacterium]